MKDVAQRLLYFVYPLLLEFRLNREQEVIGRSRIRGDWAIAGGDWAIAGGDWAIAGED